MAPYTVTVVDTTGIQPYIFGSNRLPENIGASELVRLATGRWALDAIIEVARQYRLSHNIIDASTGELADTFHIDQQTSNAGAEVIYAGGGNTVVIFRDLPLAQACTQRLTRKVLEDAPGLALVVAHDTLFDWHGTARPLATVVTELIGKRLAARKASHLSSSPLLGLGVTAECESTGMVATRTNAGLKSSPTEPTRLISREVEAKLKARDKANQRLARLFERELSHWYKFPYDMDNLGRVKGEESYVAVVHADGNGMGKRIEDIAKQYRTAPENRCYIQELRDFSRNVEHAATAALRDIVVLLTQRITWEDGKEYVAERVPMVDTYLPFRPLVFGGDDVTFVCNGPLGLSLTVEYLKAYEKQTAAHGLQDMYASAGIAIVKMHYPFARAYALSTDLARSAKSYVWQLYGANKSASALDWHIAMGGLSGSLDVIREREYEEPRGGRTLLLRPLLLHPTSDDQEGRVWCDRVEKLTREFQHCPIWAGSRNKVKALREVLREGLSGNTQAVSAFLRNTQLTSLPEIVPHIDVYRKTGWSLDGKRCGYFDAIELLDHYLHLPFDNGETTS